MAYATQVGAVMNTAVGLLQAEEVGGMKKTIVGKSYSITVGDKFEISVGDSKLTMTTDSISITSKSILVAAEKSNTIIGKNVEINPPGEASAESGSGGGAPPASTGGDTTKAQGFGGLAAASPLAMSLAENAGGDEPPEIGPEDSPVLESDDAYKSNINIEQLDKNGNYLGDYRMIEKPSNLQASVALPVLLQVPGALSLPKVPTRITTYPYTNTYDL